jgi:predicted GNAT superfamily acetyltransferase
MLKPKIQTFLWNNVKEIQLPHKQKKIKLVMKNNSSNIINLTWIEKKKSSHIRKQFYYAAREKNIDIIKVQYLPSK